MVKNSACNVGDLGSIPGLGRSPGEGKGYPLQYSGLENSMHCIVHGVTKSLTWLNNFHFHFWSRKWQSTPVLLPEKSHGQRNSVGYSPWGRKEWDTTERLHTFIALLPVTIALYYLKVKVTQSFLRPYGLYSPWNSPGQNTGVGSLSLLWEIFPTQGLNPGLLHCRRIINHYNEQWL